MAHFLDPGELLGWTRQLYDHEPEAYLLSVRGVKFDFALYKLSPPVQAAVERLLAKVRALIDGRLKRAEVSIVPSPPARAAE
jgi:Ni,Fe-hydrogenase maturation factor